MRCVPRTLRAIASSIWMALSVALIPSSGSLAQLPQDKSAPQSKFAEINGVKLHYLVAGKGDPVVLLHGFAETSHMWRPLIAKLSELLLPALARATPPPQCAEVLLLKRLLLISMVLWPES